MTDAEFFQMHAITDTEAFLVAEAFDQSQPDSFADAFADWAERHAPEVFDEAEPGSVVPNWVEPGHVQDFGIWLREHRPDTYGDIAATLEGEAA
jgi:hypothetical protein